MTNITIESQQREIEELKDENLELRTALWETATAYHDLQGHDGVFDECQWRLCKDAAALLVKGG